MDWLIEQMEDPDKRVRLFKMLVVISQGMVILGIAIFLWIFFPDYAWIPLTILGVLIFIGWYQSEPGSGQFLAITFLWLCASSGFFFLIGLLLEEQNFFYFYEDTEHGIKALGGAGLGALVSQIDICLEDGKSWEEIIDEFGDEIRS